MCASAFPDTMEFATPAAAPGTWQSVPVGNKNAHKTVLQQHWRRMLMALPRLRQRKTPRQSLVSVPSVRPSSRLCPSAPRCDRYAIRAALLLCVAQPLATAPYTACASCCVSIWNTQKARAAAALAAAQAAKQKKSKAAVEAAAGAAERSIAYKQHQMEALRAEARAAYAVMKRNAQSRAGTGAGAGTGKGTRRKFHL